MKFENIVKLVALLLVIEILSACGPKMIKPIKLDPTYKVYNFKHIVVLPILDNRKQKKKAYDFDSKLRRSISFHLKRVRKYDVSFSKHYGTHSALNADDIESSDIGWIKGLGHNNGRYTLLFVVEDVQSRMTFGSVGSAELAGYLYDTEQGKLVWHNIGVGRVGQGGLIGMMMKGTMRITALRAALRRLILALPPKGEAPVLSVNY